MLQNDFIPPVQEFIDTEIIPANEGQDLINYAHDLIEMLEEMMAA